MNSIGSFGLRQGLMAVSLKRCLQDHTAGIGTGSGFGVGVVGDGGPGTDPGDGSADAAA